MNISVETLEIKQGVDFPYTEEGKENIMVTIGDHNEYILIDIKNIQYIIPIEVFIGIIGSIDYKKKDKE